MSNFPIDYEADYVEERSRLTTFFRGLMTFPLMIVGFFYAIAYYFSLVGAWFAIVFTGSYPEGLYNFNAKFLRWSTTVNGYYLLATDEYPSFSLEENPKYPIRLKIAPRAPEQSRLTALFRGVLAIPSQIVNSVMSLVGFVGAVGAWFTIVFTGKTSEGMQNLINLGLSYGAKASSYYAMMHEEWFPPIGEDASSAGSLPPGSGSGSRSGSKSTTK